jgi:hypothetical protein
MTFEDGLSIVVISTHATEKRCSANDDLLENDKYHLVSSGGVWHVYYSERGHKWDYRELNSESDACEYLWNLLEKDETIWR